MIQQGEFQKAPEAVSEVTIDWAKTFRSTDAIATVAVSVTSGTVTVAGTVTAGKLTTFRVAGGVAGERATLRAFATAASGAAEPFFLRVKVDAPRWPLTPA